MTNAVKVQVKVNKDGVVLHSHEGWPEFHDPNRAHGRSTELHDSIGKAKLLKYEGKLTEAEAKQYGEALRYNGHPGKTFWVYPEKKAKAVDPNAGYEG